MLEFRQVFLSISLDNLKYSFQWTFTLLLQKLPHLISANWYTLLHTFITQTILGIDNSFTSNLEDVA